MKITHNSKVTASVDTGLLYWYKFKHGLGPGTMPKGVNVLKVIEDGWKDYVLLDKMLTTEELNEYEIKEETPPDELLKEAGYNDISETYREFGAATAAETDVDSGIPYPYSKWYEIDNSPEAEEYGHPAEEAEGYEMEHLAWLKAKDKYFDAFSNNGIEYAELLYEEGTNNSEPFVGQLIGDRVEYISDWDIQQCVELVDGESDEDIFSSTKIVASDNMNIFRFYEWYNNLPLKQRNKVDDWCDEWGYPLYDDCSRADLATIHDHFESEFAQSDEANFHVASFGNDFNELYDTFDTSDPKAAITKWVQLQQKFPLDVMITGYAKGEQILRDYVVAHPDWIRELCKKYKCPYDPEYLIAESEKPSRMKPSEYTDQLHPFGLG